MSTNVRLSAEAQLRAGVEIRTGTWWFDAERMAPRPAWGAGWVLFGDSSDLRLHAERPETLRAAAEAFAAAADELAALYAEHGAEPPGAGS